MRLSNLRYLPSVIRSNFLKRRFGSCGKNFLIEGKHDFFQPRRIFLGDNVYFNDHIRIIVHGDTKVEIGDNVMIGPYCYIFTKMHGHKRTDIPMRNQPDTYNSVQISDDVWIGNNVTIFPGVSIGRGSIIGSTAVVTKDVLPFSIMGGVPARLIKKRKRSANE